MAYQIGMQENDSPEPVLAPETAESVRHEAARAGLWNAVSWFRDLVFSILIAVVLIVFIYQPVKVEGTSMTPTLTDQERIFINSSPTGSDWEASSAATR